MQAQVMTTGRELNPVDTMGLCLLSLDGGGVRGLSTLFILRTVMDRLKRERHDSGLSPVKPCEVFDLIGGTSTGGLIAIMLGRLAMDVDECISAYVELMQIIFEEKRHMFPLGGTGNIRPQFDSRKLKDTIIEVIARHGASATELFNDGQKRGSKVFVCATAKETSGVTRLRSYSLPGEPDIRATICDAALATSAATGFFEPVSIGPRCFVGGAFRANNPVDEVEGEASNIWCPDTGELKPLVKCFVSIGTGNPGKQAVEDSMWKFFSKTLVKISTETEETERKFIARWARHFDEKRFFRFNVEQGLQAVGLAEHQGQGLIEAATYEYVGHQNQRFRVRDCVQNLKQKQDSAGTEFAAVYHEYLLRSTKLQTCAAGYAKESLACIQHTQSEVGSTLQKKVTQDELEGCKRSQYEELEILNWLSPLTFETQHNDHLCRIEKGTGEWFLHSKSFTDWINGPVPTLFCPGMPGAGKTMISTLVIDQLRKLFGNDPAKGIAYVYFDFRVNYESPVELLAILVRQLVQQRPSLPNSIHDLHKRHTRKNSRPSLEDLSSVLKSFLEERSMSFFVVDAVDECSTFNRTRRTFLSEIFKHQPSTNLKIMVTARQIPDIVCDLQQKGAVSLEISASEEDVQRYLNTHIQQMEGLHLQSLGIQKEVKERITEIVGGMFLLAQLYLDLLRDMRAPRDIREMLMNLPVGTEAYRCAYDKAMKRIESQGVRSQQLAKQALSWITCARRPFRINELLHALTVRPADYEIYMDLPMVDDILSVCGGLIVVDRESETIRLVHLTAQQYFEETLDGWFPLAHSNITSICITYLSFDVFEDGYCLTDNELDIRCHKYSLYDYAAKNWGYHARYASPEVYQQVLKFLMDEAKVFASGQIMIDSGTYMGYSKRSARDLRGIHIAAYFGLDELVGSLIVQNESLNAKDKNGQTPLCWAAWNGCEAVISRLLLEDGIDINRGGFNSRSPLSIAALKGQTKAVNLLLADERVDPDIKDGDGQTPLSLAAYEGHDEIVALFVARNDVNPDCPDSYGSTPLKMAAQYGHEKSVKALLQTQSVDVNSKDEYGWTPLTCAAQDGYESVARLLLSEPDIKINLGNFPKDERNWFDEETGQTPLSLAAAHGHTTVMELLLGTRSVKKEKKDVYGDTALSWAAKKGRGDAVELLLKHGARVNKRNISGQTPLQLAAENQRENVVERLLQETEIDHQARDHLGRSPLLMAAEAGNSAIVRMLVASADCPAARDDQILLAGTLEDELKVVERQLKSDSVNYNLVDANGNTPGTWAASEGHLDLMNLMLFKGLDPNKRRIDRRTALSIAAEKGHGLVVALLLLEGADFKLRRVWDDRSPLDYAAQEGHYDVVKLLVQVHPIQTVGWASGKTALTLAAQEGHERIIELLIDMGFDVDNKDFAGRTPLSFAAEEGHDRVVGLLLQNGADPFLNDACGRIPLSYAVNNKQETVVRLLLVKGKTTVRGGVR